MAERWCRSPPRMERVRIVRDVRDAASTLKHEPRVPLWVSRSDLTRMPACTVVEVEAYDVKVLLVVKENGEVLASAKPAHMPLSSVVAERLLS